MSDYSDVMQVLQTRFGEVTVTPQVTCDGIPTLWVAKEHIRGVLRYLKEEATPSYRMLYDLCGIDERLRASRQDQPAGDFTIVYQLLSYERNADVRIKVALNGEQPSLPSVVDIWPAANWYEREAWDMFGVTFTGHPNLRRLLMPPN